MQEAPVSQRDLARRAGLSHTYLGLMMLGKRATQPGVLRRLAEALDGVARAARLQANVLRRALTESSTASSPSVKRRNA